MCGNVAKTAVDSSARARPGEGGRRCHETARAADADAATLAAKGNRGVGCSAATDHAAGERRVPAVRAARSTVAGDCRACAVREPSGSPPTARAKAVVAEVRPRGEGAKPLAIDCRMGIN